MKAYDVIIVGAGPAGLACAEVTAKRGTSTLVLERNTIMGQKVCAGGITWNGLLSKLKDISERSFRTQYIYTKNQRFSISEDNPVIATVNRETLGQLMHENAVSAGAAVHQGCMVTSITDTAVTYYNCKTGKTEQASYKTLVGADGSSSIVRKYLDIPIRDFGVGINYMVEGDFSAMQWHLDSSLFGSGYAWIFPHKSVASIGAYADVKSVSPKFLKKSLESWAAARQIKLSASVLTAGKINYDYKGYHYGRTYLTGDAAGLASALTGEGIYPAIVSGEAIGREICEKAQTQAADDFKKLLRNHKKHRLLAKVIRSHPFVSTCLSELICYGLKKNILDFRSAEMAN